jgi:hypothetical protein
MIQMTMSKAKAGFFDRAKVQRAVNAATRRNLRQFGAFVRTRAQSSMLGHTAPKRFGVKSKVTNRAGTSAPGQPPKPHTGMLVKFIFYSYEMGAQPNVVIGPILTHQSMKAARAQRRTVPSVLEEGGVIRIVDRRNGKTRTARIAARPYMKPAFEIEKRRLGEIWRNSVRAA